MRGTGFRPFLMASIMALGLAACGFTPVYAPGTRSAETLADIKVAPPTNRNSYLFVREMEERLGRNLNASNLLKYEITVKPEGVESDTERRRFVGVVSYELVELGTETVVTTGAVDTFTGYSVSNGLFVSAQDDALERLIIILSDQLTRELAAKLSARP